MDKNLIGGIPMKRDDYPVIKYKILDTMYNAMKNGTKPNKNDLTSSHFNIKPEYWQSIFVMMQNQKLVKCRDGCYPVENDIGYFSITVEGIEYLFVDPLMKEVKERITKNDWEEN